MQERKRDCSGSCICRHASIDLAVANDHELDIKSTMMYRHDDYIDGITLVNDGKVHLRPFDLQNVHLKLSEGISVY